MKKKYLLITFFYFFFTFLIFFNANIFCNQIRISNISSDKNIKINIWVSTNILIGDIVDYKIQIEYYPNILLEDFNPINSLNSFEVGDYSFILPKRRNIFSKKIERYYFYKISSFEKGQTKIDGLEIKYKFNNKNYILKTDDILVSVYGIFDENDPKKNFLIDVKKLEKIRSKLSIILPFIILIILIGLLVYFYLKKKKQAQILAQRKLLPHEIAFQKLEELKNSDYIQNYDIKGFYIVLSEIFREYLENRYSIEILDKTTMEIFQELRKKGFDRKDAIEIRDVMSEMDLVKFAKYIPENEIINNQFKFVYNYIEKTKKEQKNDEEAILK